MRASTCPQLGLKREHENLTRLGLHTSRCRKFNRPMQSFKGVVQGYTVIQDPDHGAIRLYTKGFDPGSHPCLVTSCISTL